MSRTFNQRLSIQKKTGTATGDSRGRSQKTWATVSAWQASIVQLSGDTIEQERQIYPEATHKLVGYYQSDLDCKPQEVRFKFGNRTFQCGNLNNVEERNRQIEALAVEFTT